MRKITNKNVTWFDLNKGNAKELKSLAEKLNLDAFDVEDCLQITQRPKIEIRKGYIFLILRLPLYSYQKKIMKATEVDVFCGSGFIITFHQDKTETIKATAKELRNQPDSKNFYLSSSGVFLYELLRRLYIRSLPMLDHISEDLDNIENNIFDPTPKRKVVQQIAGLRRNIINLRKIMRTHNVVVRDLCRLKPEKFGITPYFKKRHNANLEELLTNIWDIIESHKETIESLNDTNEVLISYHMNRMVLLLTITSIVFLPMNLIATMFGMNTNGIPWIDNPLGFLYIIILVMGSGLILALLFKLKKW